MKIKLKILQLAYFGNTDLPQLRSNSPHVLRVALRIKRFFLRSLCKINYDMKAVGLHCFIRFLKN